MDPLEAQILRDGSNPVPPHEIFVRDVHIDTLKVMGSTSSKVLPSCSLREELDSSSRRRGRDML
ncbi:hypothetical protein [Rhizobium bangladeshense]|uniref:hypothetical protein n=1 Tax=Rhizobium bangladeshense TaxID=1138189 RepID=UPI000ACBA96E|nr:hypothetical protein [Rhizobium bangladeshense]